VSLTDEVDAAAEVAELRAALNRANRTIVRLRSKEADLVEAVYQGARDAAVLVGNAAPVARVSRDRRRSPEVALLHLTDWQLGKRCGSPDGGDYYDSSVCEDRVRTAVSKTVKLTEIQRADHPVRECHVMLGGDMVENVSIFPGQPYEVDSTAFEQVFRASALIEQTILTLLENFEKVTVHEVAGNHGRIGRKGDSPREDNLDRIVYRIARERLPNQPNLRWLTGDTFYAVVEIGEYRAMLVHGDQCRSFGGNTPVHGLLKKANAWASGAIPDKFSDLYLGHMHQPMAFQMANGGMVRMTPSTESGSAYAREFMAAHGRPGQRLCFVDPKRGRVTADYLLWLDE
jgi:hypothetical protein